MALIRRGMKKLAEGGRGLDFKVSTCLSAATLVAAVVVVLVVMMGVVS